MKKLLLTLLCLLGLVAYASAGTANISLAFGDNGVSATGWNNTYGTHSYTYKIDGVDFAKIDMTYASKQTGTITDVPVVGAKNNQSPEITVTILDSRYVASSITYNFTQWTSKAPKVAVAASTDGTEFTNQSSITIGTSSTTISATGTGLKAAKATVTASGSSNVQLGVASIDIVYAEAAPAKDYSNYYVGLVCVATGWDWTNDQGQAVTETQPDANGIATFQVTNLGEWFRAKVWNGDANTYYRSDDLTSANVNEWVSLNTYTTDDGWSSAHVPEAARTGAIELKFDVENNKVMFVVSSSTDPQDPQDPQEPTLGDSKTNPYSVAQVLAVENTSTSEASATGVWVRGYIVGFAKSALSEKNCVFGTESAQATNILLAPTATTTDWEAVTCIQLPNNSTVRSALNLADNPDNIGKEVLVKGDIYKYNGFPGLKNTSDYEFVAPAAPLNTYTVTFDNTYSRWANVNAYVWNDGHNGIVAWPGQALQANEDGLYVYTFEAAGPDYVIFNNIVEGISEDNKRQTDDLAFVNNHTYDCYGDRNAAGRTSYTIYFKDANLDNVHAYIYGGEGENFNDFAWPGVAMTDPEVEGEPLVLTATLPWQPDYVIFNNANGTQYPSGENNPGFAFENGATYTTQGKSEDQAYYMMGFYQLVEDEEEGDSLANLEEPVDQADLDEDGNAVITVDHWVAGTKFVASMFDAVNQTSIFYSAKSILVNGEAKGMQEITPDAETNLFDVDEYMYLQDVPEGATVTLTYNVADQTVKAKWEAADPYYMIGFAQLVEDENLGDELATLEDLIAQDELTEDLEAVITVDPWMNGTKFVATMVDAKTMAPIYYSAKSILYNGEPAPMMEITPDPETGLFAENEYMYIQEIPVGTTVTLTYNVDAQTVTASWEEAEPQYMFGLFKYATDGEEAWTTDLADSATIDDMNEDGEITFTVDEWEADTQFFAGMVEMNSWSFLAFSSESQLANGVAAGMLEEEIVDFDNMLITDGKYMTLPASANGCEVTIVYTPADNLIKASWTVAEPTIPTGPANDVIDALTEVWNFSATAGTAADATWLSLADTPSRDMCVKGDKLYVLNTTSGIYASPVINILNAYTGEKIGNLSVNGIQTGPLFKISSIKVLGDKIVASSASKAEESLYIYVWDDDNSAPRVLYSEDANSTRDVRIGDRLSVSGTWESGKLILPFGNGTTTKLYIYSVENGVVNSAPEIITLAKAIDGGGSGSFTVIDNGDNTYWVIAKGGLPTRVNASGAVVESFKAATLGGDSYGTAGVIFKFGSKTYAAMSTYLEKAASTLADGAMVLADITDAVASATKIGTYPAAGLGGTRNTLFLNEICYQLTENESVLNLWVMTCMQGIAMYTFDGGRKPAGGEDPQGPEDPVESVTYATVDFMAQGWTSNTAIYTAENNYTANWTVADSDIVFNTTEANPAGHTQHSTFNALNGMYMYADGQSVITVNAPADYKIVNVKPIAKCAINGEDYDPATAPSNGPARVIENGRYVFDAPVTSFRLGLHSDVTDNTSHSSIEIGLVKKTDAIENVEITVDENAGAEYYNLQGVRVNAANLTKGIYIVRIGNKASKVLVK